MAVQLYAFTCGYLTIPLGFMLAGAKGLITVPIPSYLVIHPKGRVLFDTGLHVHSQADPQGYAGEMLAKYHTFHYGPGEEVTARLQALQIGPEQIDIVVNSHLHFDHAGGNTQLTNADIVVQRREVDHAKAIGDAQGYLTKDWDTGQRLRTVDGEHDLFSDGEVVCLPTYGHTPGHQSLRVRTELGGEFILCGDACYLKDSRPAPDLRRDRRQGGGARRAEALP